MKPLAGLAGLAVLLAGCASGSNLRLQATVADDPDVIAVPALAAPAVNLDAGFVTTAAPARSTVAAGLGLGSFAGVAEVAVREGDRVTAGQEVVRLDDRLLRAALAAAEADATVAEAQVGVLKAAVDELDDAAEEIADKRAEVKDAIAELKDKRAEVKKAISELTKTRAKLTKQRATVRKQRDQLVAQRKQLQQVLETLPPEAPNRPEVEAGVAKLTEGIGKLNAALKQMDAGLKKLNKGLKQAKTGLSKLDKGIKKADDGLGELADAADELSDARAELVRLQRLATVAVDTMAVGVDLAREQLGQAVVTAPRAGVVVTIAAAGDRLAPGATLATIRPDGPTRLITWLSPVQAAAACVGDPASVHADWGQTADAQLTRIATAADFPPTSQATDETHLTRAFAADFTTQAELPAGAPVTISLQPCRPNPTGAAEGDPHGNS